METYISMKGLPYTLTFSKFFNSTSYSISAFGGMASSAFPSALKAYFDFSSIRDFSPFLNFSIALSRPSQIPNSDPSPNGKLSSRSSKTRFPCFPTSLTANQCHKLQRDMRAIRDMFSKPQFSPFLCKHSKCTLSSVNK